MHAMLVVSIFMNVRLLVYTCYVMQYLLVLPMHAFSFTSIDVKGGDIDWVSCRFFR